jgi:2-oxoglutarate ferredoxin oxidoreductase subunit delta
MTIGTRSTARSTPIGASPAARTSTLPIARRRRSFSPLEIAADRCKGCGLCVDVCPKHVLTLDTEVVNPLRYHAVHLVDATACTSCALCARICPDAIFTVYARSRGDAA